MTAKKPDEPIHGRTSSYTNRGCRCEECKAAKAKDRRLYYEATKALRDVQMEINRGVAS